MTAQQLKNSILQMAVQGKLVPQDPNDEPASVLLERIRAEKERLIKEKKIKKEKNPSIIFKGADNIPYEKIGDEVRSLADEVPFDIPDSWEWVTLQAIATSSLGKILDKAKNKGDLKPYLCSINVYWDGIDLTTVKEARLEESELTKYLLRPGDLLICEGGDVGRSAVWESTQEMYYQNALHRVRFYGGINPHFFQLLLECYKGNQILDAYSKGMTIKHLVQTALKTIIFPLPPLSEQTRIVDAVNRLLPYLHSYNRAEQQLTALNAGFPEVLKRSILQEAVQGKLVPQDPSDEPAEALLERIRTEKQRLIKEKKIKKDKHESVIFRRDNSHYEKRGSEEVCIDEEIPFEIPSTWMWSRLSSIVTVLGDGIHGTPVYSANGTTAFINGNNLQDGKIVIKPDTKRVTDEEASKHKRCLTKDTVLLSINGTIGNVAFYDGEHVILGKSACYFNLLSGVSKEYVRLVLETDYFAKYAVSVATGTTIKNVPLAGMRNLLVPIPPTAEQAEIVQAVALALNLVAAL